MKKILLEIFNKKNDRNHSLEELSNMLEKYSSLDEYKILKDYFVESNVYDTKTQITEIVLAAKYIDSIKKNNEIINLENFLKKQGFKTLGKNKNNNLIMIEEDFVADISTQYERLISISFYMKDRDGLYYEYKYGEYK